MKRKWIVIIILLVLSIAAVSTIIYSQSFNRKSITKNLSERAKEYLKDKDNSQSLREVNVAVGKAQPTDAPYGTQPTMNDCFNFTIPYTINNHHHDGVCNDYFSLTNPLGTIYANEYPVQIQSLNELSDIVSRRRNPEKYEESHLEVGGRDFLVFRDKEVPFQKTAFYFTGSKVFVFTLTSDNVPQTDKNFAAILASLQLL
jgi:hypothetical protein